MKPYAIFICLMLILASGCRKSDLSGNDCTKLRQAILSYNKEAAAASLTPLLVDYSKMNLEKLTASLSARCDVQARIDCYDCIKTLPSQTEIIVSFSNNGVSSQRVLDISYDRNTNRMKLHNIHD